MKYTPSGKLKPMFVSFILEPLWQMYNVCLEEKNAKKLIRRATNIGTTTTYPYAHIVYPPAVTAFPSHCELC